MAIVENISIIVLTYNNWKLLNNALTSISNQKAENYNIEVIISDDGTNDFDVNYVIEMLKTLKLYDITKIIINKNNLGTVKSFNNAIKSATGNIIIPLSADDFFYNEISLNKIVEFFKKNPSTLIATSLQVPFDEDREYAPLIQKKHYNLFENNNKLLRHITIKRNIISGASTYYRKELFSKYGYFDESYRLLEDYPFYLKILSNGESIGLIKEKTVKYRKGGVSTGNIIHPQLDIDLRKARRYSLTVTNINILRKRKLIYNKIMTKEEQSINKFKYIEQYLMNYIKNIFK
ncbi:hypothetical protein NFHSH190041_02160 [Shewanella sp. NFH-SH190041]|uniref:glycosyltransferase n=1 Tax=Shewanella sp. NFH-SH190041 TaxID=2950245 RepID=UPI0021C3263D|nr:glycosyltransferase [Shewanella sp. NFH-SH190041]BDM62764.1 hypothetical protein NFHSH190041_02160 [Shewanella sp. NFH-SH190041]